MVSVKFFVYTVVEEWYTVIFIHFTWKSLTSSEFFFQDWKDSYEYNYTVHYTDTAGHVLNVQYFMDLLRIYFMQIWPMYWYILKHLKHFNEAINNNDFLSKQETWKECLIVQGRIVSFPWWQILSPLVHFICLTLL